MSVFLKWYFLKRVFFSSNYSSNCVENKFEEGEGIKIFFNLLQLQNIFIITKLRTCIDILKERDFN